MPNNRKEHKQRKGAEPQHRSADGPRPHRPRGPYGFEISERALRFRRAADGDRPRFENSSQLANIVPRESKAIQRTRFQFDRENFSF